MPVRILIEGNEAERLGADLVSHSRGQAQLRVQNGRPGDKDPLSVIVAVATIAGSAATIVDCLLAWRDRRAASKDTTSDVTVMLVTGGERRDFSELTDDEILYLIEQELDQGEDPDK
jgi:hypothetical protein